MSSIHAELLSSRQTHRRAPRLPQSGRTWTSSVHGAAERLFEIQWGEDSDQQFACACWANPVVQVPIGMKGAAGLFCNGNSKSATSDEVASPPQVNSEAKREWPPIQLNRTQRSHAAALWIDVCLTLERPVLLVIPRG